MSQSGHDAFGITEFSKADHRAPGGTRTGDLRPLYANPKHSKAPGLLIPKPDAGVAPEPRAKAAYALANQSAALRRARL